MSTQVLFGADSVERLSLPPNTRTKRSLLRTLLAVLFVAYGAMRFFSPVLVYVSDPLHQFAPVISGAVAWIGTAEGVCWVVLGVAVGRGLPALIRISLALILLAKGTSDACVAFAPPHYELLFPLKASRWEPAFVAAMYLGLAFGILRAFEWSRRALLVVGLAMSIAYLAEGVAMWTAANEIFPNIPRAAIGLVTIFTMIFPAGLSIYASRESTRRHFESPRD